MKIKLLIGCFLCCLLFQSCATQSNRKPQPKEILSSWQGTFESDFHTDGVILNWILYNDGTMTGKWETKKGSSVFNVEGTYKDIEGNVSFEASGTLILYNKIKTQAQIFGKGILDGLNGNGSFRILIEHKKYPNDKGFWYIKKI